MKTLSSYSRSTTHDRSAIFNRWADPGTWASWDPEVRSVRFDAPVALGKRGKLRPVSGPGLRFAITALRHNELLTNTGSLPGAHLEFEHVIDQADHVSLVSVTVRLHGPLEALWARVLTPSMSDAARSSVEGLLTHLDGA